VPRKSWAANLRTAPPETVRVGQRRRWQRLANPELMTSGRATTNLRLPAGEPRTYGYPPGNYELTTTGRGLMASRLSAPRLAAGYARIGTGDVRSVPKRHFSGAQSFFALVLFESPAIGSPTIVTVRRPLCIVARKNSPRAAQSRPAISPRPVVVSS
jgi:hypothetical protein